VGFARGGGLGLQIDRHQERFALDEKLARSIGRIERVELILG
jgi:hypothetical protein